MDIELAKKQKLNWQALLIEETQSKLKVRIKDLVLNKQPLAVINEQVITIINSCIKQIEIPTLADSTKAGLLKFASRIYYTVKAIFGNLGQKELIALLLIANGDNSPKNIDIVEKIAYNSNIVLDGRLTNSEWRVPLDEFSKRYMQTVEERMNVLAKLEAKEDYTSRLSLRNLAEIQVRQEHHEEELQSYLDAGVKLVWIVPHANCSERCQPFQDRLYSLDGTSGVIDGIKYEPIQNATDIYETTKSGKRYKNGCLSGFNCRHTTKPYKKDNRPLMIPANVIEKARKIDQKQRYLERGVRLWRDRAMLLKGFGDKKYKLDNNKLVDLAENYRYARRKAIEWNKRYIEYSKKNGVAYYPSRTKII